MTHEDICNAFRGDTLLAVLAPAGTMLEVAPPEMVSFTECNKTADDSANLNRACKYFGPAMSKDEKGGTMSDCDKHMCSTFWKY